MGITFSNFYPLFNIVMKPVELDLHCVFFYLHDEYIKDLT